MLDMGFEPQIRRIVEAQPLLAKMKSEHAIGGVVAKVMF